MIGRSTYPSPPAIELARQPGVVIIDDDGELTRGISRILRARYNCQVIGYSSLEAFLADLDKGDRRSFLEERLDLILLDFHLPGRDGPRLITELAQRRSPLLNRTHIMGITADGEPLVLTAFKDVGVVDVLQKPLRNPDFGTIATKAYRICSGLDSPRRPQPKIFTKYV